MDCLWLHLGLPHYPRMDIPAGVDMNPNARGYQDLEEQLEAASANLDFCIEQRQRLEEQLETLQAEYRDFVNEISFPTFEDSRIEWVEVQIDKDVLAGARSRTASFPASNPESPCSICRSYGHFTHNHPEGYVNPMYSVLGDASNQDTDPAKSQEDE